MKVKQLAALKTDTKLGGVEKIEKLRAIGSAIDAKITPLLNPEQQQKFLALRDAARREMIEKMAGRAEHAAEQAIDQHL